VSANRVVFPGPKDHQKPILMSEAREKIVACGRRWGKTVCCMIAAIVGHGTKGGTWRKGALEGGNIWWVAPTYRPSAVEVWEDIKRRLHDMIAAGHAKKDEQGMRLTFPFSGGSFTIKSSDRPDLLRGVGLDGVVQDEAAFQDEAVYYSVLRPALADKKGWWIGISTPNGVNWFKEKFDNSDPASRWRRPSFEAPWMGEEERQSLLHAYGGWGSDYERIAEMDERYRQEFLAEFVAAGAGAFDPSWWREWEALPTASPRRKLQCWDTAYGKGEEGDFSVCVTASEFDDGIYLEDVWRGKPSFPDLKAEAIRLYGVYRPHLVLIEDKASGQSLIQELRRETDIPIHPVRVDRDKRSRVSAATPLVQGGRVFLPKHARWKTDFVNELAKFPSGRNDDQVDAFAHLVNYIRYLPPEQRPRREKDVLCGGPCWPDREEEEEDSSQVFTYGDTFSREEIALL